MKHDTNYARPLTPEDQAELRKGTALALVTLLLGAPMFVLSLEHGYWVLAGTGTMLLAASGGVLRSLVHHIASVAHLNGQMHEMAAAHEAEKRLEALRARFDRISERDLQ